MHGDFEPLDEYNGDVIRIDRLIEFLPTEHWSWDETGEINLDERRQPERKRKPIYTVTGMEQRKMGREQPMNSSGSQI